MDKPVVWIIDADHWPRAELRALLVERGYDAVGIETLGDAVMRTRAPRAELPSVIVVDLSALDGSEALLPALFATRVPAIGVAGAVEGERASVRDGGWAVFLRRPVTLGEIADAVSVLKPHS
jgi:hypothetical protein